ncbi:hypothetical protein [Gluconacetobacter tumulicola]|uniref:Uncharacterized protein n=1 Tax=Gluconacetobacter tumulicola TaxID=1017177 RepID=A0A7W4JCJ2_9PROT|nr:hypothetical protein [Gluconacetobacter tumulicola]MBB2178624.1 hypothetical protein [Gluconacetobacter tumulicola]
MNTHNDLRQIADLTSQDKTESENRQALNAMLAQGEQSGVSAWTVPEIFAAVKGAAGVQNR